MRFKGLFVLMFILVLSMSFASAGLFDFFKKKESITITGNIIDPTAYDCSSCIYSEGGSWCEGVDWRDGEACGPANYTLFEEACESAGGVIYDNSCPDLTPRISAWCGKVNQHTDNGVWKTDPDGVSGCEDMETNEDRIEYCQKWYGPGIVSAPEYSTERIYFCTRGGSDSCPYVTIKPTYECSFEREIVEDTCEEYDWGIIYNGEEKLNYCDYYFYGSYSCDDDGSMNYSVVACPADHFCSEGVCVEEDSTTTANCTDTDGGINYYEKGILNDSYYLKDGEQKLFEDSCASKETMGDGSINYAYSSSGPFLAEYSCNTHQGADFYECPNGCVDGACVDEGIEGKSYCEPVGEEWNMEEGKRCYLYEGETFKTSFGRAQYYFSIVEAISEGAEIRMGYLEHQMKDFDIYVGETYNLNPDYPLEFSLIESASDGSQVIFEAKEIEEIDEEQKSYCEGNECKLYDLEVLEIEDYFVSIKAMDDYPYVNLRVQSRDLSEMIFSDWKGELDPFEVNDDLTIKIGEIFYSQNIGESYVDFIYEIEEDEKPVECDSGCVLDNKCVSVCYRNDGRYCSLSGEFITQRPEGAACDNSCECDSNVCAAGECVSGNMIQKLINWVKRLFGVQDNDYQKELNENETAQENLTEVVSGEIIIEDYGEDAILVTEENGKQTIVDYVDGELVVNDFEILAIDGYDLQGSIDKCKTKCGEHNWVVTASGGVHTCNCKVKRDTITEFEFEGDRISIDDGKMFINGEEVDYGVDPSKPDTLVKLEGNSNLQEACDSYWWCYLACSLQGLPSSCYGKCASDRGVTYSMCGGQ